MSQPLLRIRQLQVSYPLPGTFPWSQAGEVRAVSNVNFDLSAGQTLGLVGESGCGKSTLARALIGLQPIKSGAIIFDDQDVSRLDKQGWREIRKNIQIVFQDPLASLNPRMTVGENIAEPLVNLMPELDESQRQVRVVESLVQVGLEPEHLNRYPHEFSGGQCQRVGIARALVVEPKLLICDEAVSALDVSIQAQIIELLQKLQRELNLAILFIAHDLAVVKQISHKVVVMYLGKIMEQAPSGRLFDDPKHPYTRALLSAVPIPDPHAERSREHILLEGELPSPANPPSGCVFRTRCPMVGDMCSKTPNLRQTGEHAAAACHYVGSGYSPLDLATRSL